MSEDQAVERLNELTGGDKELAHYQADNIVLEYLRTHGGPKVYMAYMDLKERADGFWYA